MRASAFRTFILACLLVAGSAMANFDTRPVDRYSIANGLSQNSVWSMAFDAQGFLWIGTEDGLNRFDGVQFRVFRKDELQQDTLSDNFVTALAAEGESLYVATRSGSLQRLDLRRESFSPLPDAIAGQLRGNPIDELLLIGPRHLLVGTRDQGLFAIRFDPGGAVLTGRWEDPDSGLPSNQIRTLLRAEDGAIWVGTADGLCLIRDLSPRCTAPDWPGLTEIRGADIGALQLDRRGRIWIGAMPHGLLRVSADGSQQTTFSSTSGGLPSDRVESLLLDAQGRIWAGTDRSVARFDESCSCFVTPRALGRPPDMTKHLVVSMTEDSSGGLWIGYFNQGLERIALDPNGIRHYKPSTFAQTPPSTDQVRTILPHGNNHYWLGMFGDGTWELETDPAQGLIRDFRRLHPVEGLREGERQVWSLARVGSAAYLGTDGGLLRFDTASRTMERNLLPQGTRAIRQLLHDPARGVLWVGSEFGLCRFQLATDESRCAGTTIGRPGHLGNRFVFAIHVDRQDRLWAGTWNGLFRVDPETLEAWPIPEGELGMPTVMAYDIAEESNGQLWIGSNDGLIRFTPGQPGEVFRERQGLANRVIYGIEPDSDDNLWLSSVRGVMRFDPRSKVVTTYDQRDGLQGDEFFYGAHATDPEGRILFGGLNGVNRIEPGRISRTLRSPDVYFSRFFVLGEPLSSVSPRSDLPRLEQAPGYTPSIRLGPRHNLFGVEFAAPEFDQPGMLAFEYQLTGFDDQWIKLDDRRYVSFTNLAPGDYTLSIRARNRYGEASLKPATLAIEVTPPVQATWWFRTLGAILLVGIAWGFYGWRTQDLRRQRLRLEREVARSTEEVRSQNRRLAEQQDELERANRELFQLSNRDALTGAYNRRYIQEHLSRAVAGNERVAVAILDIDHFKRINDRHGHLAGDDCLRHVVACMSEIIGDRATFARWGGEEFLVLLTAMDDDAIADLLERLRARIASRPAFTGETEIPLTASIGWFQGETGARAPMAELIRRADEALYQAKADGRNRVLRAVAPA